MDTKGIMAYLIEFKPQLIEKSFLYTVPQVGRIFRCNGSPVYDWISNGQIKPQKERSRNQLVDYILHTELIRFARSRNYKIKRDIEEVLFEGGVVSTRDILAASETNINYLDEIIRIYHAPRFNISASRTPDEKPYYRLPILETITLFDYLHKKSLGIIREQEMEKMEREFSRS